ncbi:hypothetical protein ISCGN_032962 [Ixodes scapularis]
MTTSAAATNSRAIGRECVGAWTQWDADEALIGQSGFRRTVLSPDRACEPRVGTGLRAPGCSPPAVRRVTCRTRQPLFAGYLAIALTVRALQQPASFHGPPALDGRHLQGSHRGPGQQPYNYWRSRQDVDVVGDFEVIDCHQEDDACCCCGAPVVTPPSAGGDNGPGRRQEHRASRVTLLTTETRRGTSTVPHGAADSSDMEASGGQGSPPNSQAEELGTTLEIEREKTLQAQILLQQLEVQLKMTELTAIRGARAGVGERDPGIERGEALKHYSKMIHGAIPKFPQEAEVPVWFETVECLFERHEGWGVHFRTPEQHLWERLESVQRRATRIICGTADGSYDARLVWVPLVGDPPREATGLTDARTVPDARWTAFRDLVVLRSADKQKNWAA